MNKSTTLPVKLARPAQRALAHAGITTLKQLASYSRKELAGLHGIGPNALAAIEKAMKENGLSFSKEQK